MATIALYAGPINRMPELVNSLRRSVVDYKTELSRLKTKAQRINTSAANLDEVIRSIQSSVRVQEQKIESLNSIIRENEAFIVETVRIDLEVAAIIQRNKDAFYKQYYYLKPKSEKALWEKLLEKYVKVNEWCKEHWKLMVVVVIVIVSVVIIVFCPMAAPILIAAAKGALWGAAMGGAIGGLSSWMSGGSFLEGFEEGAFSGALTGAFCGALGAAGEMFAGSCRAVEALGGTEKVFRAIKYTFKVSAGVDGLLTSFDMLAFGIGIFDNNNPLVTANQKLHSSKVYNFMQFTVSAVAAFSGGAYARSLQGPPKCFVAGTLVLTAGGLIAIENIKAGDRVLATDPDTRECIEKTVLETYVREVSRLVHLQIHGEELVTTSDHPFYVNGCGFLNAGELYVGAKMVTANGEIHQVEHMSLEVVQEPQKVYNFQVEDFHTYHVGAEGVLVHNASEEYGGGVAKPQVEVSESSSSSVKYTEIKTFSAEETNQWFIDNVKPDYKPPYKSGTVVKEIELTENTTFVRVYDNMPDGSGMYGSWVMKADDIKGLTSVEIQDKFALPNIPKYMCDVELEAGTHIRVGEVNPLDEWGNGGGTQYDLIGQRIGKFKNERILEGK